MKAVALRLLRAALLIFTALQQVTIVRAHEQNQQQQQKVTFVNERPDESIDLFWENHSNGDRKLEGTIEPRGGFIRVDSFIGHEFSYDLDGVRHYVVPGQQSFVVLSGKKEDYHVVCEVTTESQQSSDVLNIIVKPYWSPRGASRFLELVRLGYYDGVALNRVVSGFLCQFGIAKDPIVRDNWGERTIFDDFPLDIPFQPGYLSYAGSGPDSRTTEVFVVMPGVDQEQLDYFGENSWETPFGMLDGNVEESALAKIYSGYGDMPPWGKGPDSNRIYDANGYTEYLPNGFPELDYIDKCYLVEEVGIEEEL